MNPGQKVATMSENQIMTGSPAGIFENPAHTGTRSTEKQSM